MHWTPTNPMELWMDGHWPVYKCKYRFFWKLYGTLLTA